MGIVGIGPVRPFPEYHQIERESYGWSHRTLAITGQAAIYLSGPDTQGISNLRRRRLAEFLASYFLAMQQREQPLDCYRRIGQAEAEFEWCQRSRSRAHRTTHSGPWWSPSSCWLSMHYPVWIANAPDTAACKRH